MQDYPASVESLKLNYWSSILDHQSTAARNAMQRISGTLHKISHYSIYRKFSKIKINIISFNQVITNNSNEVKNRHALFGNPTSLGKYCTSKCTFMAFP